MFEGRVGVLRFGRSAGTYGGSDWGLAGWVGTFLRLHYREMGRKEYEGTLYPELAPRELLLRHKLARWRAGSCFQPHLASVRNYVFSEALHPAFLSPMRISARLGLSSLLVALLHCQLTRLRLPSFPAFKLDRQYRLYLGTEAVYLYQDEYSARIERELRRSWTAVLVDTVAWQVDSLQTRYIETIKREIYQGEEAPGLFPRVSHLKDYLETLTGEEIEGNQIDWGAT